MASFTPPRTRTLELETSALSHAVALAEWIQSRFTEQQIIGMIKEHESRMAHGRKAGHPRQHNALAPATAQP
jgi:hypothetical protein